ncbi:MAG TPA: hypothetical protein VFJ58_04635 [Armatimonadota bacterium]|nr:hypothetical protein [Armatimonadota bacterium]
MRFYLNELSLHGQFTSVGDFLPALKGVIQCRRAIEPAGAQLFVSKDLFGRAVFNGLIFSSAVGKLSRDQQRDIYLWIDRSNWSSHRLHSGDDFYSWHEDVITESSLAEAACAVESGFPSAALCFDPSECLETPLRVEWTPLNGGRRWISVDNYWSLATLQRRLEEWVRSEQSRPVASWAGLIEWAKTYCESLTLADYLLEPLKGIPFSDPVARQSQRLLGILNVFKNEFDGTGVRTARGNKMYDQYFTGSRALFSDESDSNKSQFKRELTFKNPASPHEGIFCPFHGKISTQFFRIHFSWPITASDPVFVVYIGPKITKG